MIRRPLEHDRSIWTLGRVAIGLCLLFACLSGCSEESVETVRPRAALWPEGDLVDVAIPAADHAIVIGADGRIFTTRDRGEHWQIARRPAVGALRGVAMAGPDAGWAFGAGVVLRTDDGGRQWRRQRLPGRAADLELLAIAAVDAQRAIVVGESGQRFLTRDGGALWQSAAYEPLVPGEAPRDFVAVACRPGGEGLCYSLDDRLRESLDGGLTWSPVRIADAVEFDAIEFGFGLVDVPRAAAARLAELVDTKPSHAIWTYALEAGLSTREFDRIGDERDPSALFSLVEARLEEVRLALEARGVPADRVVLRDAPPWDYEDTIDEDRDRLRRYWDGRRALGPRVRVHPRESIQVGALAVNGDGAGCAVGRAGRGLCRSGSEAAWTPVEIGAPHALLDVAWSGDRGIAVGRQGAVWARSPQDGRWAKASVEGAGVFFESLRAVAFEATGPFGLIVGEGARILRSVDGGASWRAQGPATQGNQPPFR